MKPRASCAANSGPTSTLETLTAKVKSEKRLRRFLALLSLRDDRQNSIRDLSQQEGSVVAFSHAPGSQNACSFKPQGLDAYAARKLSSALRRGSGHCRQGLLFFSNRHRGLRLALQRAGRTNVNLAPTNAPRRSRADRSSVADRLTIKPYVRMT
jgi:hypothetical protein